MKRQNSFFIIVCSLLVIMLCLAGSVQAKDFYKMSTPAAGTPYVVLTTFAKIVGKYNKDLVIQVSAEGVATRHAIDAAKGETQFFMSAPSIHRFMVNKLAMYKKVDTAPELSKNLRGLFNFPVGLVHIAVYDNSKITSLDQIKGKRVFMGAPGGAARRLSMKIIEAKTGYKPGVDFKEVKLSFGSAKQAFQDRQLDVYMEQANIPATIFTQVTLTNKIRLLGLNEQDWENPKIKALLKSGRTKGLILKNSYGKNQVNSEDIQTFKTWVGISTNKDMPDDKIYNIVKSFWEHIDEFYKVAPWMKAVSFENAFQQMNMPLHPGAARYYKEIGLEMQK